MVSNPVSRSKIRRDIEGLRAVAVLMVLVFHLKPGWLEGGYAGVDVFFVISGFLITRLLLREHERTGAISLREFYARRVRRLLPAASLVLIVTASAAYFILPRGRLAETGTDVIASALYLVNWWLARRSVDYLAEDSHASLLQHFWSLSIEEQFYIFWPLLLLFAFAWAVRLGTSKKLATGVILLLVALPSFGYSVWLTYEDQALAYFYTTTRIWELAAGAAVATSTSLWSRLPTRVAVLLSWAGLFAIVLTGFGIATDIEAWPGYSAMLPVLGAAAVIIAGHVPHRGGAVSLLGGRTMVWIGGLSYSLYLWHWPLAELSRHYYGVLDIPAALVVAVVSILLSWGTLRWIENPARNSAALALRPLRSLAFGLVLTAISVAAGLILISAGRVPASASSSLQLDTLPPGARVLADDPRGDRSGEPIDRFERIVPDPAAALQDLPEVSTNGCQVDFSSVEPKTCYSGNPNGRVTIAMVGDSKIGQWQPALEIAAKRNRWRIQSNLKNACGFHDALLIARGSEYRSCREWSRATLNVLLETKPDFVLVSHGRSYTGRSGEGEFLAPALARQWGLLLDQGIKVIVLMDTPYPRRQRIYECVEMNSQELSKCAYRYREGAGTASLRTAAADLGVPFIDLMGAICPTDLCPAVIGGVLVYRQGSHLTASYVATMSDRLERELRRAGVPASQEVNESASKGEPSATIARDVPLDEQVDEPVADADFSFDGYSLPIPCRRTSDARESTAGGNYRNVIVFACRSHDVRSAASAMRGYMEAHGRTVSGEGGNGDVEVMVARMPGTYNTTIRVSAIGEGEPRMGSRVRLEWFSKD